MHNRYFYVALIAVSVLFACKKAADVPASSTQLTGSWRLMETSYISIAGLSKRAADPAMPIAVTFNNTTFTKTQNGIIMLTGPYQLIDKAPSGYGTLVDFLKVNRDTVGSYRILPGKPDTLLIEAKYIGPDIGYGETYLRTGN